MKHVLLIALLALLACSKGQDWTRDMPEGWFPEQGIAIQFVPDPSAQCGLPPGGANGCALRAKSTVVVLVRRDLAPELMRCVISHEIRHALGETEVKEHERPAYGTDCGDGRVL